MSAWWMALALTAGTGAQDVPKEPTMTPDAGLGERVIPADLGRDPFTFADAPTITSGAVAEGGVILSGRLRYAYTARLAAPFAVKTSFGPFTFDAGTDLYGVPFPGSGGGLHGIIWCMPFAYKDTMRADCISAFEKRPVGASQVMANGYLVTKLVVSLAATGGSPLRLAAGPMAVADGLTAVVRATRWSPGKVELTSEVIRDGKVLSAIRTGVPLKDGIATVGFGGGTLRLRAAGRTGSVEVLTPVGAADSIVPRRR